MRKKIGQGVAVAGWSPRMHRFARGGGGGGMVGTGVGMGGVPKRIDGKVSTHLASLLRRHCCLSPRVRERTPPQPSPPPLRTHNTKTQKRKNAYVCTSWGSSIDETPPHAVQPYFGGSREHRRIIEDEEDIIFSFSFSFSFSLFCHVFRTYY
jgi:hypothetical protein